MNFSSCSNWIPKEMLRDIETNDISSLLIAWEGWRRGLSLSWHSNVLTNDFCNITRKFSLQSLKSDKIQYFYGTMGAFRLKETFNTLNSKLTGEQLNNSVNFTENNSNQDVYRVYVVGNEVVAVTKKVPANVIGDGRCNIKELISNKNKIRKKNPYLTNKLINVDEDLINFVKMQGFNLESIPQENERIFLNYSTELSKGADSINIDNNIPEVLKKIAVEKVDSVPGLNQAGLDIVYTEGETRVTGIFANADIAIHIFPFLGKACNVPKYIVDFYFPETKNIKQANVYFDFKEVKEVLDKKYAKKITLPIAPTGNFYTSKIIVSGKVQKVGYRQFIRNKALKKGIYGHAKNLKNGDVEVVVGGSDEETIKEIKQFCLKGSKRSKVEEIKVTDWDGFIKLGFEIL